MAEPISDIALWEKGLTLLKTHLGPVEAFRFLAMVSRDSFDYQSWRREHFDQMSLDEILDQARSFTR
jgi:hypothetical protein